MQNIKINKIFIILILLSSTIWLWGLFCYVNNLPIQPNNNDSTTDGIVIFTGGTMRLEAGLDLLQKNKAKRILVSGVGSKTDLDTMLILSGKLPDNILELKKRIDLGYEAKNTRGNAIEVTKWVKDNNYQSIRLVTANYHMPRSYFELSTSMPNIKIIKNPVFPNDIKIKEWWRSGVTKRLLFLEYNKYIAARIIALLGA